jgi:hypothetical protein
MRNASTLVIAVIICASCTQDISKDEKEPVISYQQFAVTSEKFIQSTKFLKREVSFLTGSPQRKNIRIFSYNGTNRCTEIKIGTIDSSLSNPVFTLAQTLTFKYGGASLLPELVYSVRTVFPNLVTAFYFKYNSSGLKVTDSVRVKNSAGEPADKTIKYVYEGGNVYSTPVLTGFPIENHTFDTLTLLENGNMEKLVSRIKKSAGDQIITYKFTYDQSISPYNKLNIANSLYFENPSIGIGYNVPKETHYLGVTTNNLTSWSSGSYTVTIRYVYDADNYPVRKEIFLPGNANPYQIILYEY